MTALAALIQCVEAPEPADVRYGFSGRPGCGQEGIGTELWDSEITIKAGDVFTRSRDYFIDLAFEAWRNRIATNVQAQQLAAGIKVETVGEAIERGYYEPRMQVYPIWETRHGL
jgi:hypothetical protein